VKIGGDSNPILILLFTEEKIRIMKKKYYRIIGIIAIFVFIIYLSVSGIQTISTDKNVYSLDEEIKIHWSDFSLQWESCDFRVIKIYKQEATGWKRISHELYTFGAPVCVNGEAVGGSYPCDVSSFQFPSKIFENGDFLWNSKIYENIGTVDFCFNPYNNETVNGTFNNYLLKNASAGKYKIVFGNSQKIIEIK